MRAGGLWSPWNGRHDTQLIVSSAQDRKLSIEPRVSGQYAALTAEKTNADSLVPLRVEG